MMTASGAPLDIGDALSDDGGMGDLEEDDDDVYIGSSSSDSDNPWRGGPPTQHTAQPAHLSIVAGLPLISHSPVNSGPEKTQLAVRFFWLDRKARKHGRIMLTDRPDLGLSFGDNSPGKKGEIKLLS